jgi:hypothetical protein
VDTALLVGLLTSYSTFCDDVFGETSPLRPLFGLGPSTSGDYQVDETGASAGHQKCVATTDATRKGSELSTPHTMEFASFALCMNLPNDWRLPPVQRRAKATPRSSLLERPSTGAALWRGLGFHKDRKQRREAVELATVKQESPQTDAWPWELRAPAFWQRGARFWRARRKKAVNPFEAALEYIAKKPQPAATGASAKTNPSPAGASSTQPVARPVAELPAKTTAQPAAQSVAQSAAQAASQPTAQTTAQPAAQVPASDRVAHCQTFQKFVGALLSSGDLPTTDFCDVLSLHYAAAGPEPDGTSRPESAAVLFRGTPLGVCAERLAGRGNASLQELATSICNSEVSAFKAEDLRIPCASFGEFAGFLEAQGELSPETFCGLFSPDWRTFSTSGSFSYDKCLQVAPSVISMDVSTEVMSSTLFDVCAKNGDDEGNFTGARAAQALACAPLRRAVLDLRHLGLLLPETACHSLAVSLHPDTYLFDACGARLESIAGLQTLTRPQQADLIEQDCLQGPSGLRPPGRVGTTEVCAWIKQSFLDLSKALNSQPTGNMLCSLMEDSLSQVDRCVRGLRSTFAGQDAEHQVLLAQQLCVQESGDADLCARFAAAWAEKAPTPERACAELATGEGETTRRMWVRSCAAELAATDLPGTALCLQQPLARHQQACERVLAATDRPRDTIFVCERIWASRDEHTCLLTPWSDWGSCSTTCGEGRRTRRRLILSNVHSACDGENLAATEACEAGVCDETLPAASLPAPVVQPPLVGRGASSFFVAWTLPPHPLTKMTLLVTKDGGGEVSAKSWRSSGAARGRFRSKGLRQARATPSSCSASTRPCSRCRSRRWLGSAAT